MNAIELQAKVKAVLVEALGDRLRQVIQYGSTARGEALPESDIDYLVVLRGPISLGDDLDTIIQSLYPIQLEIDRPIHALPVDEMDFEAGDFGLYRSAKREGVAL